MLKLNSSPISSKSISTVILSYSIMEEAEEKKPEAVKCPICGTVNKSDAEQCILCMTRLAHDEEGDLRVSSPKPSGDVYALIDIEDPATRKTLEELTIIPGVDRRRAVYLYKSGIMDVEEFLQKAFHGERFSENFARTVANKLLLQSLKKDGGAEEIPDLICPSCDAANPVDTERCKVCSFEIEKEMAAVNLSDLKDQLSDTIKDVFEELAKNEDFEALPEEMKTQFALALE